MQCLRLHVAQYRISTSVFEGERVVLLEKLKRETPTQTLGFNAPSSAAVVPIAHDKA